jgi:CHAT domain-containing protein
LLLGGADQQPQAARFGAIADTTGDLPFARAEADFAARSMGGTEGVTVGALDRASAVSILRASNWIHFACHAQQSIGDPEQSGIVLGPGSGEELSMLSLPAITRDVRLARGSTVILSACETGSIWPFFSGEVVSVAAAFVVAGASRVVATQWPVDDACACLLLRRFYSLLAEERTVARALRAAQVWTRSLTQAQVHDELAAVVREMPAADRAACEPSLQDFAARRADVRPFEHASAWGAFFVVRG